MVLPRPSISLPYLKFQPDPQDHAVYSTRMKKRIAATQSETWPKLKAYPASKKKKGKKNKKDKQKKKPASHLPDSNTNKAWLEY